MYDILKAWSEELQKIIILRGVFMDNNELKKTGKIEELESIMDTISRDLKLIRAQLEVMKNDDSFTHVDVSILAGGLRACCEVQSENIVNRIIR